jgi:cobalamin biosynthesis Co2+ chelatase CbiK
MKINCVEHYLGMNFAELTLAEKTSIKNFGRATPYVVISPSSSSRIQTYVRKFHSAAYDKRQWLNGFAETDRLFGILINHIKILTPPLPYERPASRQRYHVISPLIVSRK